VSIDAIVLILNPLINNMMEGQYTNEEMLAMSNIITSVAMMNRGLIIRKVGRTVNYYSKCSDDSWLNYDCKTTS
jgi:hypothetical protein